MEMKEGGGGKERHERNRNSVLADFQQPHLVHDGELGHQDDRGGGNVGKEEGARF